MKVKTNIRAGLIKLGGGCRTAGVGTVVALA
jgi:hypothetical protein